VWKALAFVLRLAWDITYINIRMYTQWGRNFPTSLHIESLKGKWCGAVVRWSPVEFLVHTPMETWTMTTKRKLAEIIRVCTNDFKILLPSQLRALFPHFAQWVERAQYRKTQINAARKMLSELGDFWQHKHTERKLFGKSASHHYNVHIYVEHI